MKIEENVSLVPYSTMRLGGNARYLAQVKNEAELQQLINWAQPYNLPIIMSAGGNWDEAGKWTVDKKLSGIEFMSLVPGTVGAAPVQNVGAYGGEISDT